LFKTNLLSNPSTKQDFFFSLAAKLPFCLKTLLIPELSQNPANLSHFFEISLPNCSKLMSSPNPPQNIIFTFLSQQSVHSSSKPSLFLSSLKTLPCCPISIENKLTPVFKTYLLSKSTSKHDLFFSPNEASPLPQNPPYFWALSVQKVEQQPRLATLRSQKSLRGIQREFLTNWPISICGGTFNWCASDTSFHFYTAIFNSLMLEASLALV